MKQRGNGRPGKNEEGYGRKGTEKEGGDGFYAGAPCTFRCFFCAGIFSHPLILVVAYLEIVRC